MKLVSYRAPGGDQQYGEVRDGRVVAFDDGSTVKDRLASGDRTPASGPDLALDDVELLAPHVPRAIFGIGLNYLAHAQEQNAELPEADRLHEAPASGRRAGARCARRGRQAPGLRGRAGGRHGAGGEVAGFAVADDLTARDLQRAERQWTRAKGFDGRAPFGPWSPPPTGAPSPATSRCARGSTASCARLAHQRPHLRVPEIVAFLRETITLEPGDLILTGTPSGVGFDPPRFLGSGDVVRIEIEGSGHRARGGVMRACSPSLACRARRAPAGSRRHQPVDREDAARHRPPGRRGRVPVQHDVRLRALAVQVGADMLELDVG
jgi:2-keto-4-pentenoate hydratase/2-oxohepta-3-ene-1,7-dioic acid hydratase in catechol pathway